MSKALKRIVFTAERQVEVQTSEALPGPARRQVAGETLYSLVSSGTEVTGMLSGNLAGIRYPAYPGYAAVFRVDEVGEEVTRFGIGDTVLCMGCHQSHQCVDEDSAVLVPGGLPPEVAPMGRLMNVSMTTLMTTSARPGEGVVVTGLGPVGLLAALMFKRSGYRVYGVDPVESRRSFAARRGLDGVFESLSEDCFGDQAPALVVECSGQEEAVLGAAKVLRECGEVVLVGVPWARTSTEPVHSLLYDIFHRYITVRSGWEWEIPRHAHHFAQTHTIYSNIATAMVWLKEWHEQGVHDLKGLFELVSADDAPAVYSDILERTRTDLMSVFTWQTGS